MGVTGGEQTGACWAGWRAAALGTFLVLTTALAGSTARAEKRGRGVLGVPVATLNNGAGDGTATVTVDAYGEFGEDGAGPLTFDPAGTIGPGDAVFYSGVWFSGEGAAGQGGQGLFLGSNVLDPIDFDSQSPTQVVSHWHIQGLRFDLVQDLLPSNGSGTTFRQAYTITNNSGGTTSIDLIRHCDGDLTFDQSLDDSGGVSEDGQLLFEFDSADNPASPTTFLGIDLNDQANLGFRIMEFLFQDDVNELGRAALTDQIESNQGSADLNGDRLTDFPFDVTLSVGQTFTIPQGGSVTFVTNTILGQGSPAGLLFAPSNLTATATRVDLARRPFTIETDEGPVRCRALIIATGASPNLLGLPSEQQYMGRGVSTCATCDGYFFKDQEVAVVGGGDAAMEEALYLSKLCTKVTVIHRRDKLRASKIMAERAQKNPRITFQWNSAIEEILGKEDHGIRGVRLKRVDNGERTELKVDGLFIAIGHTPNTDLFRGQLDMDELGYLRVTQGTMTKMPGVFAAGDVVDHVYRQAVTAAGMGCMAAMDAERWLERQGE